MPTKPLIADRLIATLQISGASATAVMLIQHLGQGGIGIASLLIFLAMFVLFAVSFFAGIWLWQGELRGYKWTALSLALQVPVLQSFVLTWKFAFGFGLVFSVAGDPGQLSFIAGGSGQLFLMTPGVPFLLGLNLYAIIALAWILRRQQEAEREPKREQPVPGPASSGALLYTQDPSRLGDFYGEITAAVVQDSSDERLVLKAADLQFIICRLPEGAEDMPGRNANPLKLFFTVPSIDAAGAAIIGLGGQLLDQRWPGPGFVAVNAVDPDGNLFHLRERTA